jgi:hypothetical protein
MDNTVVMEVPPTRPDNALISFIKYYTGGAASPYPLTPGPVRFDKSSLPPPPEGLTRVTVVVDGVAYFPLLGKCPAVNCTAGDSIARAIQDPSTAAYLEAAERAAEKRIEIASTVLSVAAIAPRAARALAAFWKESSAAIQVADVTIPVKAAVADAVTAETKLGPGSKAGETAVEACCCFPAGTPVVSASGTVPIEQINVGQLVYARNPDTGATELKPVTQLMVTKAKPLYRLVTQNPRGVNESMDVTDNHPYWVKNKGWVDAINLEVGMVLESLDLSKLTVVSITSVGRSAITYNFTVADFHTYFAGEQRAFVHNCSQTCGTAIVLDPFGEFVLKHNTQIVPRNGKTGTVVGAHNADAFFESLEKEGGVIRNTIRDSKFPGLIEYQYQLPKKDSAQTVVEGFKPVRTKTVYDPKIISDQKIAEMSSKAATQGQVFFDAQPLNREFTVKVDGYYFQVTKDTLTGKVNNAFIALPPRGFQK